MATNGIQMALRYTDMEQLQKSTRQQMVPSGAPNLYAHARGNGTVNWLVRVAANEKRSNITIGKWPAVKAEDARQITPAIKAMLQSGSSIQSIKNALKLTLDPIKFAMLVRGEKPYTSYTKVYLLLPAYSTGPSRRVSGGYALSSIQF